MGARRVDRAPRPGDPERMGTCNRKRFLEAMAPDDSAEESLRANGTL